MKVSAIIPVLNAKDTIKRTLNSVFDQTYSDWELIIVDGGSSDGTLAGAPQGVSTKNEAR